MKCKAKQEYKKKRENNTNKYRVLLSNIRNIKYIKKKTKEKTKAILEEFKGVKSDKARKEAKV